MKHIAEIRPTGRRLGQFCSEMGISRRTAYREIKAGNLHASRFGRVIIIPDTAARTWIEAASTAPESQA